MTGTSNSPHSPSPSQKPTSASAVEPLSALARLQRRSLAHADCPALQLLHHIVEIEACGFLPDREFLERLKPPLVDGEPLQTSGGEAGLPPICSEQNDTTKGVVRASIGPWSNMATRSPPEGEPMAPTERA